MDKIMLQISNLSYSVNGGKILDDLDVQLVKGNYFALAGENGAGKSTLIKIILDLIRNTESGSIRILGFDNKDKKARENIAYLPEKFDIKTEVTGWQYLKFIAATYLQTFDSDKIESLCDQLGLDSARLKDKSGTYSKGMKQKLGLISCFMLDTPLVILDEPLSGLDPKARYHFKQLLENERKNNRTIFYSTHMLADAEEICDQFAILHQGSIAFNGTPQQCMEQYHADTLEKAYMNCITQ